MAEVLLSIKGNEDVVRVRQAVREKTVALKFSLVDQTKLVTAASELARNTMVYGGGGVVEVHLPEKPGYRGIQLVFIDHGPGIADIERALTDGFTTGGGMGLGLGGAKRLCDDFSIDSRPGVETRISITKWKKI